jgi:Protein of unknown function (DUF3102)
MTSQSKLEHRADLDREIVRRINEEWRAFERDFRSAAEHAIRCGELLEEKKGSLGHGEWLPWLRDNFEGSERHAQRFMKLAREHGELDPTRVSDLSIRGAMRKLSSGGERVPSVAEEIASHYEWPTPEDQEEFAALSDMEQAVFMRSELIFKYMVTSGEAEAPPQELARHRTICGQLEQLDAVLRPVDLPAGKDRDFCEGFLTYRQMHQTIAELVDEGVIRRASRQEVFESVMSSLELPDNESGEGMTGKEKA